MLVKITTQCSMGCTHCMEEALPEGEHMSLETFKKVLPFIEACYNGIRIILLSGGEPTNHPDILKIIEMVKNWNAVLLSNGLFYSGPLKDPILDSGITIQVYNDPNYYDIVIFHDRETKKLEISPFSNPAIFLPEFNEIVWGIESWWGVIEKEDDLRQITDKDIQNIWYVKALKAVQEKKDKEG